MTDRPRRRMARYALVALAVVAVALVRSGSLLGYSNWIIDEERIVGMAVGFIDFDLNPRWYNYHPLPMYLLAVLYYGMYAVARVLGLVASKPEFVSLLFTHDAVFYVPAKLLGSLAYTAGCAVLAGIVWRRTASRGAALVMFVAPLLLQDGIATATQIRNDTFVFLFLALTVYFACFAPKRTASALLAVVACAAAFAAKVPAIVAFPVLLAALAYDAWRGRYPWRLLGWAVALFPVAVFVFMPHAFLDFPSYWPTISWLFEQASGETSHLGKVAHAGMATKASALIAALYRNTGAVPLAGTVLFAAYAAVRDRAAGFAVLFVLAYGAAFSTSQWLDDYWLRPVYPFLLLFPLLLAGDIASRGWLAERWRGVAAAVRPRALPAPGVVLTALLAVAYAGTLGTNLPRAVAAAMPPAEPDTRIVAGDWIRAHVPPGSRIILEGMLPHYQPRVFTPNPDAMLWVLGYRYPSLTDNALMVAGFRHYFSHALRTEPRFEVVGLLGHQLNYDLDRIPLEPGDYVVLSSASYGRYYRSDVIAQLPEVAANAQAFFALIRRQEAVRTFTGNGPRIEIWRLREGWAAGGRPGSVR